MARWKLRSFLIQGDIIWKLLLVIKNNMAEVKVVKKVVVTQADMDKFPEVSERVKTRNSHDAEVRVENMKVALAADKANLEESKARLGVEKAREEARVEVDFTASEKAISDLEKKIGEDEKALAEATA